MGFRKQKFSIGDAKEIDMVNYLTGLGYEPSKIRNADYWYLSPLREEKVPSFKINRKINRWYDHGLGKGGNIIDFAIIFHQCTVGEFLQQVNLNLSSQWPPISAHPDRERKEDFESKITIIREGSIYSYSLSRYLQERRIPMAIADQFCIEVRYELNGKEYFGIGFKNDSGGYEIRNPYFKASSSPKGITTFNNGSKEVVVFEGFFDFLSFKIIHKNQASIDVDFVILNSVSFFENARPFMEKHEVIRLYLDRDTAGQNYSRYAISLSEKYTDESSLYKSYKDLNDWIMNFGKGQKINLHQKLQ